MGKKQDKKNRRKQYTFLFDVLLCVIAFGLAEVIAYNTRLSEIAQLSTLADLAICLVTILVMMFAFDCYSGLWKYAGRVDFMRLIMAHFVTALILLVLSFTVPPLNLDLELVVIFSFLSAALSIGFRFFPWITNYLKHIRNRLPAGKEGLSRALIIGAGYTGAYLITRFINNPEHGYLPVAIIDDDPEKHGMTLSGVKVVGGREKLLESVLKYEADIIIIAIQNIKRSELKEIYERCRELDLPVKTALTLSDGSLSGGSVKLSDIKIENLLGRDELKIRRELVDSCVKDKRILITGGAGSIGSELCRQVLKFGCRHLVIFDMHENGLFDLDNELSKTYPEDRYTLVIGNIRDTAKLRSTFEEYQPEVVFHAAAYKHVPMMEINPLEAIKTNVFGSLNVVNQCDDSGVEKLIFISTDKAVNPANVMGATKRIAEMIVQARGKTSRVKMAAVRFGNVVGSNGSAIPFFLKQISEGGPVTVTHRDIKRYFMTIPEAVSLVLQTGAFAQRGEIFVLDMGEPVNIYSLAEDLIRLSGYVPHKDMEIKIIGLRKGEKLFEELRFDDEMCDKTSHEGIFVTKMQDVDGKALIESLKRLKGCVESEDNGSADSVIFSIVPSVYREKAG